MKNQNHTNMAIQRYYADDSPFDEHVEDIPPVPPVPIRYYDVDDNKPFDERSLCSKRPMSVSENNVDAFEEDDNSTIHTYLGTQYDDEFSFSLYDQSTIQTEEYFDNPTVLKRIHSRKSRRRRSSYFPSCQISSLCGPHRFHNDDNDSDSDSNGSDQSEFSYSDISSLFMCTRLGKRGSIREDESNLFCMIMKDFKTFFYVPLCSFRSKPFPKPKDWKEYTSLHACLDASAVISCN
ncbi:MAG: hypothetical protein ACI8RD_003263 [Bacillariaceae sp.]|jgi:hypothetical protein